MSCISFISRIFGKRKAMKSPDLSNSEIGFGAPRALAPTRVKKVSPESCFVVNSQHDSLDYLDHTYLSENQVLFSVRAMADNVDLDKPVPGSYGSGLYQHLPFKRGDRINIVNKLHGGALVGYIVKKEVPSGEGSDISGNSPSFDRNGNRVSAYTSKNKNMFTANELGLVPKSLVKKISKSGSKRTTLNESLVSLTGSVNNEPINKLVSNSSRREINNDSTATLYASNNYQPSHPNRNSYMIQLANTQRAAY
ncbi:hypothetical protein AYI69_g8484 [Smittium culicis]|uniref:Uncharacterized protein n=1 Tax=Smittium culicis TaxID=133412 RepID=A0A1R1XJ87_9FUNG|nr:hypothetical protein AYI69_g8484 [Smittium culicis]